MVQVVDSIIIPFSSVAIVLLCILLGLGLMQSKNKKLAKVATKPNEYVASIEKMGHRAQVIDLDTGEVYEPKAKPCR